MPNISNFTEAAAALRPFYQNATRLHNLNNMQQLMRLLGDPHDSLKVLHVAGTSGKTSTAYYCAALLRTKGLQVGLTASPHVDAINERLQMNGQPLAEAQYCAALTELLTLVADSDIEPSYFELLTALSYWQFARRQLDYVVIEVGMGGQLDATNVATRPDKVCLITDIGFDHTSILGNTLASISGYKAGIIHAENQVFMYRQSDEVMQVINQRALSQHATITALADTAAITADALPLFQQRNLGLAVAAVNYTLQRDGYSSLTSNDIALASQTLIPARLEKCTVSGKTVYIDGSHNQQKLRAMFDSLQQLEPNQPIAAVVGFVDGTDTRWQQGLDELLPRTAAVTFTGFAGEQDYPKMSVPPEQLQTYATMQGFANTHTITNPTTALQTLLQSPQPVLLVTGSFYLMHHIRAYLQRQ